MTVRTCKWDSVRLAMAHHGDCAKERARVAVVELGHGPGRDLGPDMDMRAITAQWVSAHTKHVAVFGRGYAIALNASLL